jgi:hypothetical protein
MDDDELIAVMFGPDPALAPIALRIYNERHAGDPPPPSRRTVPKPGMSRRMRPDPRCSRPPFCARILFDLSANGPVLCGLPVGHDGPHGGPHWTGSQGIDPDPTPSGLLARLRRLLRARRYS